ncbi:Uncharacterised protein [Yersinia aldovae]|nr:hypothetical protein AT01_378 [Yersinia aldovae 670-83]CNI34628.1 Uncharacterised protein [Yersinia aldovae]
MVADLAIICHRLSLLPYSQRMLATTIKLSYSQTFVEGVYNVVLYRFRLFSCLHKQ